MTKEREYRAYAGTCVDLANKANNDEDKKHLLAMAEAWLGLADRVQRPVPEPDTRLVASGASGKVAVSDVGSPCLCSWRSPSLSLSCFIRSLTRLLVSCFRLSE